MKQQKREKVEEYNPYCEKCGGCGYIGCCGIKNFIKKHIKGKTNCKNEDVFIAEILEAVSGVWGKDRL